MHIAPYVIVNKPGEAIFVVIISMCMEVEEIPGCLDIQHSIRYGRAEVYRAVTFSLGQNISIPLVSR